MANQKEKRKLRIQNGVRAKISGSAQRPRLSVFRSNKEIYAQLIDDISGATLCSFSSQQLKDSKGNKTELSQAVGKEIANLAKAKGVEAVVFDRGAYLYHGRVKALAEGAREAGLKF